MQFILIQVLRRSASQRPGPELSNCSCDIARAEFLRQRSWETLLHRLEHRLRLRVHLLVNRHTLCRAQCGVFSSSPIHPRARGSTNSRGTFSESHRTAIADFRPSQLDGIRDSRLPRVATISFGRARIGAPLTIRNVLFEELGEPFVL